MVPADHPDFNLLQLGRAHEPIEVDTRDAVREACLALAAQAQRELALMSRHLDPALFDNLTTSDAVRDFVLRSRRTRMRILVKDPEPGARHGHRLVELARRLPSFVEIRVPAQEYHGYNAAFLVADSQGAVHRGLADRYEATVCFGDRHLAGELMRQFDEMWETARADPALRRIHL